MGLLRRPAQSLWPAFPSEFITLENCPFSRGTVVPGRTIALPEPDQRGSRLLAGNMYGAPAHCSSAQPKPGNARDEPCSLAVCAALLAGTSCLAIPLRSAYPAELANCPISATPSSFSLPLSPLPYRLDSGTLHFTGRRAKQ